MNINDHHQELIDQFLQGILEGKELDHFLVEMDKNPDLKKELQTQKAIMEGIEFNGNKELRQRFSKISKEVKQEKKSKPGSNGRIIRFLLSTAAAIALLLMVLNLFFKTPNSNELYAQFYQPFEFSNIRSSNLAKEIASANQLYSEEKFTQAIPVFESILKTQPENAPVQLAFGNALSNVDQNDSAILQFQSIINRKDQLYTEQAKWYLALTYLKTEKLNQSKTLLQELSDDPNADYHKEAKKLLSLLSK